MAPDIRKPLKKFLPHLIEAREKNLNEADTIQRIEKLFELVLGYDILGDVSREAQLKGKYVDMVLKIDGQVRVLVEAKSAATTLRDRHIEQAQGYASRNNYQWVVLTNGVDWKLFHLTFEEGIDYELAFGIDLSEKDSFDSCATKLALLHKQSIRKGGLEKFWRTAVALGPASIARGLFHEATLAIIRRLVRKHEGFLVDPEDLAKSIRGMLTTEAREQIGPLKIRKTPRVSAVARAKKKKPDRATTPTEGVEGGDSSPNADGHGT